MFLTAAVFSGIPVFSYAETRLASRDTNKLAQDWMPCTVSDPTGTPLNVRSKANGRVIAKLKNGTLVEIDDTTAGKKWSRISFSSGKKTVLGWVLRDYLSCQ